MRPTHPHQLHFLPFLFFYTVLTLVVWDVDLLSEDVIKVYRYTNPECPIIYKSGDIAEAEPALPEWTMPVDELFE